MSNAEITKILTNQNTEVDAQRTTSLQEELFILGYGYQSRNWTTATPGTNLYIHYDARATSGLQIVFIPPTFVASDAGPVTVKFYITPTLTVGGRTPMMTYNRRATSKNTHDGILEWVAAANVSAVGTEFAGQLIPSNSSQGSGSNSGSIGAGGDPFEINPVVDYLIEIDNTNSTNTLLEYNITWFEFPLT